MTTLQEAAQRALIQRLREHDDPRLYREADELMSEAADALAALANEPQACLSVSSKCERQGGLSSIHEPQAEPVEQPGAVGLSEQHAKEIEILASELARCRDAFPVPDQGSAIEQLWLSAMADPCEVAEFVVAAQALATQPVAPGWIDGDCALPPAYMLAKLKLVMPVFQEARDALPAITEQVRQLRGISSTLADRMDEAGTFSLDDWLAAQSNKEQG